MTFTCFGQCFEEKRSFRRNYFCFISLDCKCQKWCFVLGFFITSVWRAKNLQFFGRKDLAASSKLHFTFGRHKFEEKIVLFLKKKQNVLFCFELSARKILVRDEKFMVALLDLLSTCLANMSRIMDNLSIFWQLSGFEQKEVGVLVQNFPQDCRNYIIRVQKIISRRGLLYGRIIYPKLFLDQECKLFTFLIFFLRRVSKHEGNLSRSIFGDKNFLEKK